VDKRRLDDLIRTKLVTANPEAERREQYRKLCQVVEVNFDRDLFRVERAGEGLATITLDFLNLRFPQEMLAEMVAELGGDPDSIELLPHGCGIKFDRPVPGI